MRWNPDEIKKIYYIAMVIEAKGTSIYEAVTRLQYQLPDRSREAIRSQLYKLRKKWNHESRIRTGIPRFGE